jgi:hypothetical protein
LVVVLQDKQRLQRLVLVLERCAMAPVVVVVVVVVVVLLLMAVVAVVVVVHPLRSTGGYL